MKFCPGKVFSNSLVASNFAYLLALIISLNTLQLDFLKFSLKIASVTVIYALKNYLLLEP